MTSTWVAAFRAPMLSPAERAVLRPSRAVADRTLRQVVHLPDGAPRLRLRLSHRFGSTPLVIERAGVALRTGGARTDPRTHRPAGANLVVAPGSVLVTEPVDLDVPSGADVVVSLYLRAPSGLLTFAHTGGETGWLLAGDAVDDPDPAPGETFTERFLLAGVDVPADGAPVIVTFGDSLMEGAGTTVGANRRFPDALAGRLAGVRVVSGGIGGNRLLGDEIGERALARFDRDVLDVPGVRAAVLHAGLNDLGLPAVFGFDAVTPGDLVDGYRRLAARAARAGIRLVVATVPPLGGNALMDGPAVRAARREVNDRLRDATGFDAVVDTAAALADPADPERLHPAYDSGDHVHPNDAGAAAMADIVAPALGPRTDGDRRLGDHLE